MSPCSSILSTYSGNLCLVPLFKTNGAISLCFIVLFVLVSNPRAYAAVPVGDLAAHWQLDEGSGLVAADMSGNGNTGALINSPTWISRQDGRGLEFDGVNDLVTVEGKNFDGSGNLTIAARIHRHSSGGHARGYVLGSNRLAFYADRNNRRICFTSDNTQVVCSPIGSLRLDTWQNVAVVQNAAGGNTSVYVEGQETRTNVRMIPTSASRFAIGNYPQESGTIRPFAGVIDDVRVYTRALSTAEIQALFTKQIPPAVLPQFDFSITNSGAQSVTAGASVTNTITTTVRAGNSQPVSFSASGLPTGAVASFSVASCSPSCSTNVTIATSSTTPTSTSSVTIASTGGGVTKTTTFTITVTPPPASASPAPTPTTTTPAPPQNGLVAHWRLDDGSGNVASDASGHGHSGALIARPTWVSGKINGALSFDGTSDYVAANGAAADFNKSAGTIVAWLYRTFPDTTTRYPTLVSIGAGVNDNVELFYFPRDDMFHFHYKGDGVNDVVAVDAGEIPANRWVHIAMSWDTSADALKAYIDGRQMGTTQTTLGRWVGATNKAYIGSAINTGPSVTGWQGLVDDVQLYTRALSGSEIQTLFLAGGGATQPSAPFNFSMTTGGNRSVTAGGSVTNAITTTILSGSSQPVSFAASGLPAGVTATFSTATCSPTCLTNITISTSPTTLASTSDIIVTGTGGGVTKTANFSLTVGSAASPPVAAPPSTDAGVSDAPLVPVNKRLIVVAQDGSGHYRTITEATDAAQPGDTIQVKNGTYRELLRPRRSGTREAPITFMAYAGHRPKIEKTGIKIEASWLIIDGFEVAEAENGINLASASASEPYSHITIRNNYLHDSSYQGAYIGGTPNVLVENNTFERNGLGPANCTSHLWDGQNYSHCHGIYLANPGFACTALMENVTIRGNRFLGNSGSGIQVYSGNCEFRQNRHLIENNLFVDNATGMYLWSLRNSVVRNNTIVQLDWPKPQKNNLIGIDLNGSTDNVLTNNALYFTNTPGVDKSLYVIRTWDRNSANENTWINNAFFVKDGALWTWNGQSQPPFSRAVYQEKTGDPAPVFATVVNDTVDVAGFANLTAGNYHLTVQSLLRNAGANAHCPAIDADGVARPRETFCDIGTYEFKE
ncbi:MAG: LamG-like jellyroll fold domain-containing protein [Candidatus Binatia bacterium]